MAVRGPPPPLPHGPKRRARFWRLALPVAALVLVGSLVFRVGGLSAKAAAAPRNGGAAKYRAPESAASEMTTVPPTATPRPVPRFSFAASWGTDGALLIPGIGRERMPTADAMRCVAPRTDEEIGRVPAGVRTGGLDRPPPGGRENAHKVLHTRGMVDVTQDALESVNRDVHLTLHHLCLSSGRGAGGWDPTGANQRVEVHALALPLVSGMPGACDPRKETFRGRHVDSLTPPDMDPSAWLAARPDPRDFMLLGLNLTLPEPPVCELQQHGFVWPVVYRGDWNRCRYDIGDG